MNVDLGLGSTLLAGDPRLVDHIVGEVKSQGIFDQFRKECIADVDTKPAYQNLRTRVESSVNSFLNKQTWRADLNKNQLRETLRKHIYEAPYLDAGVERIVDQVVNPKVYSSFMPQIEDVVYKFLGLERPKNRRRNGPCGFKDLLPVDLDPVSPESDKNSLKDVSLDSVDALVDEPPAKSKEAAVSSVEENQKDENEIDKSSARNGHVDEDGTSQDGASKPSSAPLPSNSSLNNSAKSDDKADEEEEDSPVFEPIDIMNFNDSHISNDSHLSGISELTSHRSASPDFSNDGSRDNMDFSNHDSEFSKVSSDSRLSIVTDFGSSNHDSVPFSDSQHKDDSRFAKDNFKAVREFESGKGAIRDGKTSYESSTSKETTPSDAKSIRRSLSSKETSRDGMEVASKDSRDGKDKMKDNDSSRSKTNKDRGEGKDSKKDRDKEAQKKQQNNYGDAKTDKSSKSKSRDKSEVSRTSFDKLKDKDLLNKPKEEKIKESERKDSTAGKEGKDLKDIYKEKIRELREKKEKLGKDKDAKLTKEIKEKSDSSRENKETKDSKSATSRSSSRSDGKSSKTSDKDGKGSIARSDSREKGKRDERRYSKEHKSRSNSAAQSDEKIDGKRLSRSDKDDKTEKSDSRHKSFSKKDSRGDSSTKNGDSKRDLKNELDSKDKKRRDDKKAKTKDDHSSMRKNYDDRRSTDRDGSNGSNGKNSQKSNSSSSASSAKNVSSNLAKESSNTSNSSSETSDSIEESQNDKLRISIDVKNSQSSRVAREMNSYGDVDSEAKRLDLGQNEICLPIKKRPLLGEENPKGEIVIKKPKFAKNFQEAKKLMKIRRKMEKEKIRQQLEREKNLESRSNSPAEVPPKVLANDIQSVPDDERVQIIEVQDEEYDEPYPEMQSSFTLEERSQIILGAESIFMSELPTKALNTKSTLSEMELSIRQSLHEMITDTRIEESHAPKNSNSFVESETERSNKESSECQQNSSSSNDANASACKDTTQSVKSEVAESPISNKEVIDNETKLSDDQSCDKEVKQEEIVRKSDTVEVSEKMEIVEGTNDETYTPEGKSSPAVMAGIEHAEVQKKESEENSTEAIVENLEKAETPSIDEKTNPEIVKDCDSVKLTMCEEKSVPEIVKKQEKVEALMPDEDSRPEVLKEELNIEASKPEEHSTLAIVKDEENVEIPKSEDELKPETVKEEEEEEKVEVPNLNEQSSLENVINQETSKSEENPEEIVELKTEIIEPSISDTSELRPLADTTFSPENVVESCNKEDISSQSDGPAKIEERICPSDDDQDPCLYFTEDNDRLERFMKFMKSFDVDECSSEKPAAEEIDEAAPSDEILSSKSESMAPPKPKRKYSTSPLTDILLNNANNNNEADKITASISEADETNSGSIKKRKIGRPRKQRSNSSMCSQPNLSNGENFVMPLSPESDVSATSEKTPSNPIKDEKGRPRGSNQRYTSDDLYKPRPLFASSSRRSRRSNQA